MKVPVETEPGDVNLLARRIDFQASFDEHQRAGHSDIRVFLEDANEWGQPIVVGCDVWIEDCDIGAIDVRKNPINSSGQPQIHIGEYEFDA